MNDSDKMDLATFEFLRTWENPNVDRWMVREIMEDCHGDELHTKLQWWAIYHAICKAAK